MFEFKADYQLSFLIFYLVPIGLCAWLVGRTAGFAMCFLSAVVWIIDDRYFTPAYSHYLIPLWNLLLKVLFFLFVAYLISRLKTEHDNERTMARTDYLTGVVNGRYFIGLVNAELSRARRFNHPVSMAYIDVDDFKLVNDTRGHMAGDEVLRKITDTINKNIREYDTLARLGGDEFAVLLPEAGEEQSKAIVQRIQESLAEEKTTKPVTLSIGVAICKNTDCSYDQLIQRADDLMYSVKKSGKNSVRFKIF